MKEQKGGFLGMFLGTLDATLLGDLLTGKGVIATSRKCKANMPGRSTITAGEVTVSVGRDF